MSKLLVVLQHLRACHPMLILYLRLHIPQVLWLLFRLCAVIIDYWFGGSWLGSHCFLLVGHSLLHLLRLWRMLNSRVLAVTILFTPLLVPCRLTNILDLQINYFTASPLVIVQVGSPILLRLLNVPIQSHRSFFRLLKCVLETHRRALLNRVLEHVFLPSAHVGIDSGRSKLESVFWFGVFLHDRIITPPSWIDLWVQTARSLWIDDLRIRTILNKASLFTAASV